MIREGLKPTLVIGVPIGATLGLGASVKVVAVNIDENPDLADEFDIVSIPCVILFKGGAEADRSVGLVPKDVLEEMI